MALEITVDHDLCRGAQRCVYLASEVFELNESSQADVVDPAAIGEAELVEVARQCPNFAITVVRDGEILVSGD